MSKKIMELYNQYLERFSSEDCKTKTKIINLTNEKCTNDTISQSTRSNCTRLTSNVRKRVRTGARFWKVRITFLKGKLFYVRSVYIKDSNFVGFES